MSNHKNKLIIIPNEDKTFHEKVDETNLCNFPHPFRMILCGPPNTGTQILFIIYHSLKL